MLRGVCDENDEKFRRSKLTLRFLSQAEEDAFNMSRKRRMLENSSILLLLTTIIGLPNFLLRVNLLSARWVDFNDPLFGDFLRASVLGLLVVTFPLTAVLLRVPKVQVCIEFHRFEIFIGVLILLLGGIQISSGKVSNTEVALALDCIVSGVHMFLPLRWCVVLWVDVLFVLAFAARCLIFKPDGDIHATGDVVYIISFLIGLMVAANLGLRTMELSERTLFSTVVDERSLRARAEFNLERVVSQTSDPRRQADSSSHWTSSPPGASRGSPSEDKSEALFRSMEDNPDTVAALLGGLGEEEHWLVEQEKLQILHAEVLGRGGFGLVVKGIYYGTPVAVKLFASNACAPNEHKAVLNELRVLRHLRHPNIAHFFGASLYESPIDQRIDIRLVFENVKGKTLRSFSAWMHGKRKLPLNERHLAICVCIMQEVMRAVIYLHERKPPIVHSDLKPTNIMVQEPWLAPTAKLLDFGISRVVSRNSKILGGTSGFQAPEIQPGSSVRASPAVDIFAVGRVLEYLARGKGGRKAIKAGTCPMLPDEWRSIVVACTRADPRERPTATQVHRELCEVASRMPEVSAAGDGEDGPPDGFVWLQDGGPSSSSTVVSTDSLRHAPLHAIQERLSSESSERLSL